MSNPTAEQPKHLTLTEVVFNYALYTGAGYLASGRLGAWVGAALLTLLLVVAIVIATLRTSNQHDSPSPPAA